SRRGDVRRTAQEQRFAGDGFSRRPFNKRTQEQKMISRSFRLGAFIILALLIFAGGVFWIGNKRFVFTSTYRLNADFQNVAGLLNGAEVRVGGIPEGTVKRID